MPIGGPGGNPESDTSVVTDPTIPDDIKSVDEQTSPYNTPDTNYNGNTENASPYNTPDTGGPVYTGADNDPAVDEEDAAPGVTGGSGQNQQGTNRFVEYATRNTQGDDQGIPGTSYSTDMTGGSGDEGAGPHTVDTGGGVTGDQDTNVVDNGLTGDSSTNVTDAVPDADDATPNINVDTGPIALAVGVIGVLAVLGGVAVSG